MPRAQLPRELCDLIVDYAHTERATLATCALVCRAWVPASRFHLFARISLSDTDGYAAARLNDLLASPRTTIVPAVRRLDLLNALAQVQIRKPRTGRVQLKTLLDIVPRIAQLRHIHTLALSDLPFALLAAFPKVRTLHLAGVTAGPALLRLAACFPDLRQLALKRVHAIPYRSSAPAPETPTTTMEHLRGVTVRGSSIAFLGWLALLAPRTATLDLRDFCPSEVPYLAAYLCALAGPLERLELGLSPGTAVREFAWHEVAPSVGTETRLVVSFEVPEELGEEGDTEDTEDGEATLRAQFADLEKQGMLDIRRLSGVEYITVLLCATRTAC
ncbi:hypothetical protein B0H15DRAFT_412768 [Mycena belliarum]|uniref:F-box domain-containing protein n=1 Tax=Mycena belliarum TaxID=1033014 RepID=A0AAD6UFD8_9AGAR|nr:hypothetical protein B0H15DRAFT_412768 [Mycena belliae]